jgi:hypothetical protein
MIARHHSKVHPGKVRDFELLRGYP